jgi:hypothetical protein
MGLQPQGKIRYQFSYLENVHVNPIKGEGGWVYNHREKSDASSHT